MLFFVLNTKLIPGKVNVPAMISILFFRPFGAGYPFISLTRGFTPGYMLSALQA